MANNIKNENYITISGFMINELNLKGNELLIYAIIYGFSQTDDNYFTGSLQYLSDWTNSSKQGVQKCLKLLLDKNYIIKKDVIVNNIKYCHYKVTRGMQQSCIPCNSVVQGMQQSCTYNIYNIKEIDNNKLLSTKKSFVPPTLEDVKNYCEEKNFDIDYQAFYDYYNVSNWKDSEGKQVKNWKQKMITWATRRKNSKPKQIIPEWLHKEIKKEDDTFEFSEEDKRRFGI